MKNISVKNVETKKVLDYYAGGLLLFFLKPLVIVIGRFIRRDHRLELRKEVVFFKMLGGGSLLIALPSILGIKKRWPQTKFSLVTTSNVVPFAQTLGVFDRIIEIKDKSFISLAVSGLRALVLCFKVDTVIDLEVYSRLSTVFGVFTAARNRIGFFLENIFWRRDVSTHLVYFHPATGVFLFYEQIAYLLDAQPASFQECRRMLESKVPASAPAVGEHRLIIGHACSDFGVERMLTPEQWLQLFQNRKFSRGNAAVYFLGGSNDSGKAAAIIDVLQPVFPGVRFVNHCGQTDLAGSLAVLRTANEFWGIDSSLLHYARLFGIKNISIWGPTSPETRLKPVPGMEEETIYNRTHCSPCIHVTESPPCEGNNICIKRLFDPGLAVEGKNSLFTVWPKENK